MQPLLHIHLYLIHSQCHVLYPHLVLWHVQIELLKRICDITYLALKIRSFMVKLNVIKGFYVSQQLSNLTLEEIHVVSQFVFLAKDLSAHIVQSVVVYFEDFLYSLLVAIHFLYHYLLLLHI